MEFIVLLERLRIYLKMLNYRYGSKMYVRDIFRDLDDLDFLDVWDIYIHLRLQYKFYKIYNFFANKNVYIIDFPILHLLTKFIDFFRWKICDFFKLLITGKQFNLFGVSIFCGRQGSGKTISMVNTLNEIKNKFPDCLIVTNFGYCFQDFELTDWRQLLEIRNGEKGVVFAIDEIQNEYDNSKWQDFPEGILSVITQQRKQRIKILLTSQVYSRVVKQIREQCFDVIECKTFLGRWTFEKCFDAEDYNTLIDNPNPEKKFKMPKKWRKSFIQSDFIRNCFNSYSVVEKMKKADFIIKERGK